MTAETTAVLGVSGTLPDAPFLNCDNAHLAALQQFYGAASPADPMGSQWYFRLRTPDQVPETLRVPVLDAIAAMTGLVFERGQLPMPEYYDRVREMVAGGTPLIFYGDAYHMPWLPYFGNDSSAHPTVLHGVTGGELFHVVEAYTNSTPWGRVVPGPATVTREEFRTLVEALGPEQIGEVIWLRTRREPAPPDPVDVLRSNAEAIEDRIGHHGDLAGWAQWGRDNADGPETAALFDLGCWEVNRARSCHAAWLRRLAASSPRLLPPEMAERFAAEIAAPWQRVSQFAYVNAQRVRKGSRPSTASCDLIDGLTSAETSFAHRLLARSGSREG